MDFTSVLTNSEQARVNMQNDTFNKALSGGKVNDNTLDKDDWV